MTTAKVATGTSRPRWSTRSRGSGEVDFLNVSGNECGCRYCVSVGRMAKTGKPNILFIMADDIGSLDQSYFDHQPHGLSRAEHQSNSP